MQELKPSSAARQGRGCIVLFAILWLGFSLVWTALAWRGGGAMALFGLPFIAIGVVLLVGGLWRRIAGVKIAPPVLRVSNRAPFPGETLHLAWEVRFRVKTVLQDGRVELLFRESASYTQGTDTRTDTHERVIEFHELPVGEMDSSKSVQGRAAFAIPADAMHTFKAEHNKLEWLLRMKLNAREWADLVEEYELVVQSGRGRG